MPIDTSMYQNFRGGMGLSGLTQGLQQGLEVANQFKNQANQAQQMKLQQEQAVRQQQEFETNQAAKAIELNKQIGDLVGPIAGQLKSIQDPAQAEVQYGQMKNQLLSLGVPAQMIPSTAKGAQEFLNYHGSRYEKAQAEKQAKIALENRLTEAQINKYNSDAIKARSEGRGGFDKAPAGYRYNPDGSLVPIPGGPAAVAQEEKQQALQTPYGTANTVDDAKQLKEAFESKRSFDNKINELISLRDTKGVEYLDRNAVARAKQLSKDLLLEYKNMAKLGVLSQADEAIINAIIPTDPLGQDYALFQDPILSNLKKFKDDSDSDFKTRVGTRTRKGIKTVAKQPPRTEAQPKAVFYGDEIEWAD